MSPRYKINSLYDSISYQLGPTIIDPGDCWEAFYKTNFVLLTHAHFDHIYGLNELVKFSPNALVYTNEFGREMLLNVKKNMSLYHETPFTFNYPDKIRIISDRESIELGNGIKAQAYYTPGHNPSCITWIIDDMVFTGDSYIPGIKTVTNLPDGNKKQAIEAEELIKRIAANKRICPGHDISQKNIKR